MRKSKIEILKTKIVDWRGVASTIAPALQEAIEAQGRHVGCPVHGGTDGFRLFKDFHHTGGGICNTCGAFGDGFALLSWATGSPLKNILDDIEGVVGKVSYKNDFAPTEAPKPKPKDDGGKATERLKRVWRDARMYEGKPKELMLKGYLRHRGLPEALAAAMTAVVQCHIALPYYQMERGSEGEKKRLKCHGVHPAIVSLVETMDGRALTLHRTYLEKDGIDYKKSTSVPNPKTMMGLASGATWSSAAVKLGNQRGATLNIAEGIETSLAVIAMGKSHCWAALNAGNLSRFTPPDGVQKLVVWADKDRPNEKGICAGSEAVKRLSEHLERLGSEVTLEVKYPPMEIPEGQKGVDWLDYYNFKKGSR